MVGTPWESVPGKQLLNVPTAISEEGEAISNEVQEHPPMADRHEEDVTDKGAPCATTQHAHVAEGHCNACTDRRLSRM